MSNELPEQKPEPPNRNSIETVTLLELISFVKVMRDSQKAWMSWHCDTSRNGLNPEHAAKYSRLVDTMEGWQDRVDAILEEIYREEQEGS